MTGLSTQAGYQVPYTCGNSLTCYAATQDYTSLAAIRLDIGVTEVLRGRGTLESESQGAKNTSIANNVKQNALSGPA
jgi:hypothetical protein